jgi:hypothetical protein
MKRFQYLRISAYICGLMAFVLLSGLDHEAHGDANHGGMVKYKDFFTKTADPKILEAVKKLKEKGQFDNKIFIVTADHGHTGMLEPVPTTLYAGTPDERTVTPDVSCELKLTGFGKKGKNEDAEKANNNLHIWELANLFQQFGNAEGLKLLVPKEIEQTIVAGLQNGETPAVTSIVDQANVIAALNGPMAHVYVKGTSGWGAANGDSVMLGRVADKLKMYLGENGIALFPEEKKPFLRLLSSLDKLLVRTEGQYKVFKGVTVDVDGNITGLAVLGALMELEANTDYVNAAKRIEGVNHPQSVSGAPK